MNAAMLKLTATVVAAYVSRNAVLPSDLPALVNTAYRSLSSTDQVLAPEEAGAGPLKPAVPIRKSVTPDHIVCLEDGKRLKMLKRHLRTSYKMTPEQYRVKWGLPSDYPMVAPNYAKTRSELTHQIWLGKRAA